MFVWNELMTNDVEKAKTFYAATIGGRSMHGDGASTYWVCKEGGTRWSAAYGLTGRHAAGRAAAWSAISRSTMSSAHRQARGEWRQDHPPGLRHTGCRPIGPSWPTRRVLQWDDDVGAALTLRPSSPAESQVDRTVRQQRRGAGKIDRRPWEGEPCRAAEHQGVAGFEPQRHRLAAARRIADAEHPRVASDSDTTGASKSCSSPILVQPESAGLVVEIHQQACGGSP